MKQTSVDLTVGSIPKKMLVVGIPLMFSNVLQILFNMSDVAVVGRFAGSVALGAVGSTALLIALYTGFLIGLGSGINVLVARYFGAVEKENLRKTVHTSALVSFVIGVAFLLIGILTARPVLQLLGTKTEYMEGAVLYVRIYFLGMPALALFNFGNGVMSAIGDTKRPLYYLFSAGILNVILNLIFVIVFEMGVAGVALASIISQYVSAGLILLFLFRSETDYGLRFSDLKLDTAKIRAVLGLGVASGCQNAVFGIANLFIQSGVNQLDAISVAGVAAASNADAMIYDMMAAFYVACASFMGQNYGAGKKERILKSYFLGLLYSFTLAAVLGGLLVIFGNEFLSLFTTEEAVKTAGMERLKIMGVSYCVSAFMDCTIAASRGLGKSFVPTVIVILGSCVFRVAWLYTVFAYFHTVQSLYLLYSCSWTLTAIAEIIYFAKIYREQMKFLDSRTQELKPQR